MTVVIDPQSGFCFGVVYAIDVAERELQKTDRLYCLGDIVHNNMEVNRLREKGLVIISHDELKSLRDCKVMIRAHGEPPETYETALLNNIELIDASCPIVLNLQNEIRNGDRSIAGKNGQVVIYGKEGHAEVNGLKGQVGGEAIIVGDESDLRKIDFSRPVRLYSQTTKSEAGFHRIAALIRQRMQENAAGGPIDFEWTDSICRQVSNRTSQLKEFAGQYEVVIFVSGRKSSNGMILYEVCKKVNPNTFLVSGTDEVKPEWFTGHEKVGVCGATSTPMWLMEEVGQAIRSIA
jgi:4-hydroxy-3-methylbut-2-en-1-yl diphosphate reductase